MAPAWGPLRSGRDSGYGYRLKRFQAKWTPVRVKKTRQIKNLEPRFDSIETEMALVSSSPFVGGEKTRYQQPVRPLAFPSSDPRKTHENPQSRLPRCRSRHPR